MTETRKRSFPARLFSGITALATALCMLPAMPNLTADAATTYDLKICGTQVTSENAADVLGDGVFSYNDAAKKLTVSGNCTSSTQDIITSEIDGLNIYVASDSKLSSTSWQRCGMVLYTNTTITGTGKLNVYGGNAAIIAFEELTVKDISLECGGPFGIAAVSGADVVFDDSYVHISTTQAAYQSVFRQFLILRACKYIIPNNPDRLNFNTDTGNMQYDDEIVKELTIIPTDWTDWCYDLYIADVQVNKINAGDVLGDGVFSYNDAAKTLTVCGNCTSSEANIISSDISGLTINVISDSNLSASNHHYGLVLREDTTITGRCKLALSGDDGAILVRGKTLTVKDANLECTGNYGIGLLLGANVIFDHSSVHLSATEMAYVDFSCEMPTLQDCVFTTPDYPEDLAIDQYGVMQYGGAPVTELVITPVEKYNLFIARTQVTDANAADILGNGVFSYDPETNVLTVDGNYSFKKREATLIGNNIKDLTVNVVSDSALSAAGPTFATHCNMTITGNGKLTINSPVYGVYVNNGGILTIKDADLEVYANQGITGDIYNEKLVIDHSRIHTECTTGGVTVFSDIALKSCRIAAPEGGKIGKDYYDSDKTRSILEADGFTLAKVVDIEPSETYELYIAGERVNLDNAADILGNGVFSYDPAANILTVSGDYSYNNGKLIENHIDNLTIRAAANATLSSDFYVCYTYGCDMTITGPGKLTLDSLYDDTIVADGGAVLTFKDADIDARASISGGESGEKLIIDNSAVHVECNDYPAVYDFTGGIVLLNSRILLPEDVWIKNGRICTHHYPYSAAEVVDIVPDPALAITKQPENASGCIGDKVQFTVGAEGNGLIYQWQYYNSATSKWENTGLAGNKTPTLTVSVLASRNGMKYHCIVKDANGTKLVSNAATLTVNPKIVTQPVDASGCIGDKVYFVAEATGVDLIYQWQYFNTLTNKWENTGLTGNKTPHLTVSVLASRNGMKYHCIVKDTNGTKLVSNAVTLKVNPKIVTQPVDASGCIGDKVQFTVEATGAGLIYQWQYFNTATNKWVNTGLTGNKTPTLTVSVLTSRNGMKYHCIVKDANGTMMASAVVTLNVLPKIVTQPQNVTATLGSTAKFTVEATGVGLIYQWQYYNTTTRKWENTGLAGNKTAELSVTAIKSRNGMKYHCIVKDSAGNKLTSAAATLTVK